MRSRMLLVFVLAAVLLRVSQAAENEARAAAWPEEFTIAFTTKNGAVPSFLAYDWANKQQLIIHGPNSTECLKHNTADPCEVLFNPQGTFYIIPSLRRCWLDNPDVGSLPPQWTTSGQFAGVQSVLTVGRSCRAFSFPPTAHVYMETVPDSKPCAFVFPDPDMTYYFQPDSMLVGTPDASCFILPDYCVEQRGLSED